MTLDPPRITLALAFTLLLCACPPASPGLDSGTADSGITDGGTMDAGSGLPTLLRSHSGDGVTLHAYFSAAVSPRPEDVKLLSDGVEQAATVTAVTPDSSDATHLVITLSAALPKGKPYELRIQRVADPADNTQPLKGTLHLAMVWHQHQPSYVDPQGDYLRGPWVRKHGTKDYFDMAAMVAKYPGIHVMVNLTPILLMQLEDYYLKRLGPYVDVAAGTIDTAGYFAQKPDAGATVTDPWLDALLRDTPNPATMTDQEKGWFYKDLWSNFSISDVIIDRWPAYKALRTKRDTPQATFTQDELLQMKGYFQLAWFDPDFLKGPVTLPDGTVVDVSDFATFDGTSWTLKRPFTEASCQYLVVQEYKVLKNIVPVHKQLLYDAATKTGQIEVMTTPYFHPILPLLVDSDLAKRALPSTPMPTHRFQQVEDARFHVAQAARTFERRFGKPVTGMWPAEGSVAEEVVGLFAEYGVKWIATDQLVLKRSTPADQSIYTPYRIDVDTAAGDNGTTDDELAVVFRETSISDKLGFQYQGDAPAENIADLLETLRSHSPDYGEERLLSIILDGENAWEWYRQDEDAKGLLHGMYAALERAQDLGEFRTVTVSEYLSGNPERKVVAHPTHELPELEPLFAGSWISGSFSTWIGEDEENLAWDYLFKVRSDLAGFEALGLARPSLDADPAPNTQAWHAFKAWQSMYAAEGSDWFWWYGSDQTAGGGDEPFDRIFLEQLKNVYREAQAFGISTQVPDLPPVLRFCEPPHGAMSATPTIDGAFQPDDGSDATKPNEWTLKGAGACMDVDSGAGSNPDDVIRTYYHGQDAQNVYVALRLSSDAATRLGADWSLRLYFSHRHIVSLGPPPAVEEDARLAVTRVGTPIVMQARGAARELALTMKSGAIDTATLATVADGAWVVGAQSVSVSANWAGTVIELRIPKALLNFKSQDPLEMLVTAVSGNQEVDRAPNQNAITVHADRTKLVEVTFIVDCTGKRLALDAVKSIENPPPPAGTGRAFIVGSLPELGNWAPNTIPMSDDGTNGDETASDNFFTFRMLVPPLTSVNYKYTIGAAGQGWGPTEEYPLTNRGFEVTDADGDGKMVLRDVFADRPEPSGALPPMTQVSNR